MAESAVEVSMETDDSMLDLDSVALRDSWKVVVVAAPPAVVVTMSLLNDDVVVGRG